MLEFRSENIHVVVQAPCESISADEILTPDALRFVGYLCNTFGERRQELLKARKVRSIEFDSGEEPKFLSPSEKNGSPGADDPSWRCASIPDDIKDRRVEITGPVDRKMVINGLNSTAQVYMADFEDSTSPTWKNLIEGQFNLRDAIDGTISYTNPKTGKTYSINKNQKTSVLMVRPRGWHLDESHIVINGKVASGSIFDFGLFFFHNVKTLIQKGTGPYFYLPKLENHLEARLWNDVFIAAQKYLGIPVGTIRATVLLETITAAYEMEEILYELRDHSLGLNCGRWDYLFSYIKKFKYHTNKITPDRKYLTMTVPLMDAYVKRLIYICHKRGTFAMGGMSAAIPIKDDPVKNDIAMKKVAEDKLREVIAGHDGTWVAHPALVKVARCVFDKNMTTPNQINIKPGLIGSNVTEKDLLQLPTNINVEDTITTDALIHGIKIVLAYTEAWLRGIGCIALHNAMEDAATAEISRAQVWQWVKHGVQTRDDLQIITKERVAMIITNEINEKCGGVTVSKGRWRLAGKLVEEMLTKKDLDEFLTSICYPFIVTTHQVHAAKL
jgi:malate synthase